MPHEPYAVLRLPDFRQLMLARLLVTLSVQIHGMAVGWQIYSLTKDPLSLGLVGLAEAVPAIAVSLYAGHIADVADRKMIATISIIGVVANLFLLSWASSAISNSPLLPVVIYATVALVGIVRGFYGPAVFGLTSQIVPREQYANAAAWNSALWQGCAVLGPILGGWLYVVTSAPLTYGISGILSLCGLIALLFIKSRTETENKNRKIGALESIKEGLRFVFSNQIVVGAMTVDLFGVLFGGAVALLPIFAAQVFHSGPETLGVLRAAPSIGALISAGVLAHYPIREHAGRALLGVVAGFGLCMIGFGLSTNFYISLCFLALSGLFDGISIYLRSTIYQLATPDNMKGRFSAVNTIFIGSSNEIGEFESGVAAKILGTVRSVIFGGCMTLFVVAVTAMRAPKLRELNLAKMQMCERPSDSSSG